MAEENNIEPNENEQTSNPEEHAQLPEPSEAEILQSKIVELENSVNQFKDQLLRKAAEFENYKKRVENDYNTIVKFSNESLILELLPVLDDYNRSMKAFQNNQAPNGNSTNNDSFKQGIELIYNKLKKLLENQGVKEFESIGKPFDPYYHDALLQIPKKDVPSHTVVEEIEKGYSLHDKVIRHAKVIVSSDVEDNENPTQAETSSNEAKTE